MSVDTVNIFLNGLPHKPFLPECLLYLSLHIKYIESHIENVEKKYVNDSMEQDLKYFTIFLALRSELKVYRTIYRNIREKKYWEAMVPLRQRVCKRKENLKYYKNAAKLAKREYEATRSEAMKYISQGYKKVYKILSNMSSHVEKEFSFIINNKDIKMYRY